MPTTDTLPAVDDCVDLYLRVHEQFGTRPFSPAQLSDLLDDAESGDGRSLPHLLDLLVAYGLLDRLAADEFRVRCAPDDESERWRTAAIARTERLHRLVRRRLSDAPTSDDVLTHDGAAFASVRVDDADVDAVETALVDALDGVGDWCDGVVLRSPGDLAADVQRFADRVCERGVATRDWRFEKVTTDLVGSRKDALEFRLFLRLRDDGTP